MVLCFWIVLISLFILADKVSNKSAFFEKTFCVSYAIAFLLLAYYIPSIGYKIASGIIGILSLYFYIMVDVNRENNDTNLKTKKEFFEKENFQIDKEIEICKPDVGQDISFVIDKEQKQFGILLKAPKNKQLNYELKKFAFSELNDYEYAESSRSKFELNGLLTFGGALCFGLVGGLAGAALGGLNEKQVDKEIYINLKLNNPEHPYVVLAMLRKNHFNNDSAYNYARERANKVITLLEYIKNQA